MTHITRRDLILLLLGVGDKEAGRLGGITRLQKLIYLLQREEGFQPDGEGFEFEPYKAGPYSARVYDDLEFLENIGLIKSEVTDVATDSEAAEIEEIDQLEFDDLFEDKRGNGNGGASGPPPDAYEERQFALTADGLEKFKVLSENESFRPASDAVRRIKSRFGTHSLDDLLYYVYSKYPEMTTESEIKEKVLARRSRQ